jgi:excinuclease ABC, A subunit
MEQGAIELRGVRVNNLKDISLDIPRGKFVVVTGLSGSGKSSLAFDTLYAEGQRRYVQSLSAYARQFLGRMPKPDADAITGVPPAIVIAQRVSNANPRSTVGTTSEIYDYLRLLYARAGKIISPVSGSEVRPQTVQDVVDFIATQQGKRVMLTTPIEAKNKNERLVILELLAREGYSRLLLDRKVIPFTEPGQRQSLSTKKNLNLLIDRFAPTGDAKFLAHCADSVETAYQQGREECDVWVEGENGEWAIHHFTMRLEADGLEFQQPTPALFSYNSPIGACPECEGYGKTIGIDEALVIPDQSRSVYDDAVACWRGKEMGKIRQEFIAKAAPLGFPIHRPYYQLTSQEKDMLWNGAPGLWGINDFFKEVSSQSYKIQYRVLQARYSGKTTCASCHGTRLRVEATWIKVGGKGINELVEMPLDRLFDFFQSLTLDTHDQQVADRLLYEIRTRLAYLIAVGLGYLTLNRAANTLSGGETQRINLATSLGSSLVGSLYILDEPSVGLHSVDTARLIAILQRLRDLGNTVVVVEHDEEIMRAADVLIDLGPEAGSQGGHLVYTGPVEGIAHCPESLTGQYLFGDRRQLAPIKRRADNDWVKMQGIFVNNLQNVDITFPLRTLTVVTGVSGSGKSSLVREAIVPGVRAYTEGGKPARQYYHELELPFEKLHGVEFVDQNPLQRSLRSTPVTYIKAFDPIRELLAKQPLAQTLGITALHFSFNSPGGRCENCEGTGRGLVEMQFMADIEVECEECHGTRYQPQMLDVTYRGKNIDAILKMTVHDAVAFFRADTENREAQRAADRLAILDDVGLGYVALGQPTSTLSGGEAQRLKLASFIADIPLNAWVLFAFDEPTTGLHFHDIDCLMRAFDRLLERGHSLLIIEHNLEVIRRADWVIDMGPGGGEHGGKVVVQGTPEQVMACEASATGRALRGK